ATTELPSSRRTTPSILDKELPALNAHISVGNEQSASPEATKSMKGYCRCNSSPITASQLAPPNALHKCGKRSFNRRAKHNEAMFCSKVDVKPTTAYRFPSIRSRQLRRNEGIIARSRKIIRTLSVLTCIAGERRTFST